MRRHRRAWLVVAVGAALLGSLTIPASAEHVTPTVVAGNPNCGTVGSTAPEEFKIDPASSGVKTDPDTGVRFDISLTNGGRTLAYNILDGAATADVIVKGGTVGANHYDYMPSPGPQTSDTGLTAPLATPQPRINHVVFCYFEVPPITLSGTKFEDLDLDRTMDEGDPDVGNWDVAVFSGTTEVARATTAADGSWEIVIPAGTYTVCEMGPAAGAVGLADLTGQSAPNNTVCSALSDFPGGYQVSSTQAGLDFGDYREVQLACGDSTTFGEEGVTGSFTRESFDGSTTCAAKGHATEIFDGDQVVFLPAPLEGTAFSTYSGTITLVKALQNPIPALQYDQDVLDGVDNFENVPACDPVDPPTIPEGHTWCITGVTVTTLGDDMTVVWEVFGVGDPKFR